jgi:hypothetical protein
MGQTSKYTSLCDGIGQEGRRRFHVTIVRDGDGGGATEPLVMNVIER